MLRSCFGGGLFQEHRLVHKLLFCPPAFGDIAEYKDRSPDIAVAIPDGSSAIVYRHLRSMSADKDRVIGEPNDLAFPQYTGDGALDRGASSFVYDAENVLKWFAAS